MQVFDQISKYLENDKEVIPLDTFRILLSIEDSKSFPVYTNSNSWSITFEPPRGIKEKVIIIEKIRRINK